VFDTAVIVTASFVMHSRMDDEQHDQQQQYPGNTTICHPTAPADLSDGSFSSLALTGVTALHCRLRLRPSSSSRSRGVLRLRRLRPGAAAAAGHLRHAAGLLPGLPGVRVPSVTVPVVLQADTYLASYLSS
jgi:hypothetical protein